MKPLYFKSLSKFTAKIGHPRTGGARLEVFNPYGQRIHNQLCASDKGAKRVLYGFFDGGYTQVERPRKGRTP